VAGVHTEANAYSGGVEVQDTSPKEEFDMIDQDQPQGEGDEPKYKEYPMDIHHEWDIKEADAQEWDKAYDNETQTKYHVSMILIGNEYYNRKHMFTAKHVKSNMLSTLKQELMYDHQLRKRTQDSQSDCQSKMQLISAY
jgi:hypothetical protein